MSVVLLKVAVVGALIYFAIIRKKGDGGSVTGDTGDTSSDPVIGKKWDLTVADPYLDGGRLPAVPLGYGGKITGWYHPTNHNLLAVVDAASHVVLSLSPTEHFPAQMP